MMNQTTSESKAQIVYFSHGGGPLPILGDAGHKAMVDFMIKLAGQTKKTRCHPGDQRALGGNCRHAVGRTQSAHVL